MSTIAVDFVQLLSCGTSNGIGRPLLKKASVTLSGNGRHSNARALEKVPSVGLHSVETQTSQGHGYRKYLWFNIL